MRRWLPAAALVVALATTASADLNRGVNAFKRGDYDTAFEHIEPAAREGSSEAQFYLARMYAAGNGVPRDETAAVEWYLRAAKQGHVAAQNNLGLMYDRGRGVAVDPAEAARWYRRAAETGLAVAQSNLAALYEHGRGLPKDEAQAVEWYRRAARQGHAVAQMRLGQMLRDGRGTPPDPKRADKWLRKAAKNGVHPDVARAPAADVPEPPEPPAAAAVLAPTAPPAAPTGATDGGRSGNPGFADPALREIQAQAELGDPEAQYELGQAYRLGRAGAPMDPEQAARWYLEAAEQTHVMAWYQLAFIYLRGQGPSGRKDFVQAHLWFGLAADHGVGDAADWRDQVERKMSPEELDQSRSLTDEWQSRLAAPD